MKKWFLVEAVPGPEPGVPGPLVSNPHVPPPMQGGRARYVGVDPRDRCKTRPEVIPQHPDLVNAMAKGCLVKLAGPVVAADKPAAEALLKAAPKVDPPKTKKEGGK
ncbi:MAG: hypothetical protein JSV86_07060 [Gemmatimonadota bacterium]|nr:MAG: hypothetical protein JSV86_07060 [Gemmatimonadota bacterium]